jgi:tocopherol cyclase
MPLLWHPERFHGHGRGEGDAETFFEGWYFKLSLPSGGPSGGPLALAVVPGIFYAPRGPAAAQESHAFVFVNWNGESQHYYRFRLDEFVAARDRFSVVMGGVNEFSGTGLRLSLSPRPGDDATLRLRGEVNFAGNVSWPVTWGSPGVMGPVQFLPRLECSHGILSMDHTVRGSLEADGRALQLAGARGYLEKDWGKCFPSSWVWIQSNMFGPAGAGARNHASLFFSAAHVPYMGTSFPGFICALLDRDGVLHTFTSYNLSVFRAFVVDEREKTVDATLENWTHVLRVKTSFDVPMALLYGPHEGKMAPSVPEGLQALVDVELRKRNGGALVFQGHGTHGGVEVQGDVQGLTRALLAGMRAIFSKV